jgi:hypothetical protein
MPLLMLFMLGIANFAMQKAVLESHHPLLGHLPWYFHMLNGRFSMVVEFFMLLGAMLMVADGTLFWAWAYGFYSMVNAVAAWLILSNRV